MSKFKIKVKLTGFELEIEGDRQDIPALTRSVSKQLSGMVAPPSADIFEDAEIVPNTPETLPTASKPIAKKKRNTKPKSKSSTPSKGEANTIIALESRTIESKYSSPKQQWTAYDKLMWLLYVLEKENGIKSASSLQLRDTFNKHFRTSGEVNAQNVSDLRKKVNSTPSLVGKDTSVTPANWYLKDAGNEHIESLIAGRVSTE